MIITYIGHLLGAISKNKNKKKNINNMHSKIYSNSYIA